MTLYDRRKVILAKTETAYNDGTTSAPTGAANAILVRDLKIMPLDMQYAERKLVRPNYGTFQQLPTTQMAKVQIEQELAGYITKGTTPPAGMEALWLACGLASTNVPATRQDYTPVSTGQSSALIYFYQDLTRHVLTGARGTFSLSFKRNEIPVIKWEMTGLLTSVASSALSITDQALPTTTYSAYNTPKVFNRLNTPTFALHGYAPCLDEFTFDMGNEIVFRNLINCTDQVLITDRSPKGSVSMEAVRVQDKDWWTSMMNATLGSFDLIHGTVDGNKVEFAAPNVQITNPQFGELDKIIMLNADLLFLPGTGVGNDEFTITIK